ncbi:MAG: nicotinamide-nucleotide amidohydrolase family protein, partial [Candidatus Geothermincolia bacterium]
IDAIAGEVRALAADYDAVIVTGGLGPTSDDLTTEAVAKALGKELVFHEHIREYLEGFFSALGHAMREENLKQAYLPEGADEVPAGGTAPGFMIEDGGALIAVLPGVPREMEAMMASHVLPELARRFPERAVSITRRIMTFGMGESDIAGLVADRIGAGPVKYGFLAMSGPIVVKLTGAGSSRSEALRLIDDEQKEVEKRLGYLIYGVDDSRIEDVTGAMLKERGLTIATAESLTAGMVSARFANTPGSSGYLLGGVVAYSKSEKEKILQVPAGMLAGGAVSRPVAEAMAIGAKELFGSDIAISTTGVAGPGAGGEDKPPGTVAIALAHSGGVMSLERRLPGHRDMVRNIATMAAVNFVRLHLLGVKA